MLIRAAGLPFARLEGLSADWKPVEGDIQLAQALHSAAVKLARDAFDNALSALEPSPLRTAVYNARKAFFQKGKLPPEEQLEAWALPGADPEMAGLVRAIKDCRHTETALDLPSRHYREKYRDALENGFRVLQEIAGDETFQRALLFASHSLLAHLPGWKEKPVESFTKKERQTALSVLQYASRMATKTSPLSHFTTVSIRRAGKEPGADRGTVDFGKSAVSPNVALLEALYDVLLDEPAFYRHLEVELNPCIVRSGQKQYTWLFFNGETESFQESDSNPLLEFCINLLLEHKRKLTFADMLQRLADAVDAAQSALEKYVLDLIGLGLLEWVLPERGLSPDWCGGLYRFIAFLPDAPLLTETAALLQGLRGAARVLPFQTPQEARALQTATGAQLKQYFQAHGRPLPPIPVEQLFYEDVEQPVSFAVPDVVWEQLAGQLADCWRERPARYLPDARAGVWTALSEVLRPGETLDFLAFSRAFTTGRKKSSGLASRLPDNFAQPDKIGALVQLFWENGQWHAVINGLFPGGGKLFARWLHLFSPDATKAVSDWLNSPGDALALPFPWQGYFNANFQPPLSESALQVPGGRVRTASGAQPFLLGNLEVFRDKERFRLRDRSGARFLHLTELGLEAPATRPPVMQLLWNLGVPYVSLDALLPENLWAPLPEGGVRHRKRYVYRNLVLAREAWAIEPEVWKQWLQDSDSSFDFFDRIRKQLEGWQAPRYFFAHFRGAKPQFFDRDSPALILLFQKLLQQGNGTLTLTEMLPLPEHMVVERQGQRAAEFVLEFAV